MNRINRFSLHFPFTIDKDYVEFARLTSHDIQDFVLKQRFLKFTHVRRKKGKKFPRD